MLNVCKSVLPINRGYLFYNFTSLITNLHGSLNLLYDRQTEINITSSSNVYVVVEPHNLGNVFILYRKALATKT